MILCRWFGVTEGADDGEECSAATDVYEVMVASAMRGAAWLWAAGTGRKMDAASREGRSS